jgi:uncharacterized Fe-S cluster protein YjdI
MDSNKEIVKEYSNGEITILWKPKTCIHAAECVKRLPTVYKPNEKPWMQIENATTAELKEQILACPSGALTYISKNQIKTKDMESKTKVNAMQNGPLLVEGMIEVTNPDGSIENKEKTTAFCRCGASLNKPYCDGEHRKVDFKG